MSGGGTAAYIAGVPHALPEGEALLWQSAPNARAVARHVFHQRAIALYFAAMLAIWVFGTPEAAGSATFVSGLTLRVGLVLVVLGVLEALARIVARTTTYAITDKRVVLRIGMVIPMSINIPFTLLSAADVGMFRDGSGQLALSLEKPHRIAYIALWPHCRVFRFTQPSPVLRGLLEPRLVGELLASAVAKAAASDEQGSIATSRSGQSAASAPAGDRTLAMA